MSTNINPEKFLSDWISQSEAARLRGVTRQAIGKLVGQGRLRTLVAGGHTLVHKGDVLAFEPKSAGRPKVK
jgi:excisionase family DNA binding protein